MAYLWRGDGLVLGVALGLAAVLALASFLVPCLLQPLNIFWFKLGMVLHKFMNPVVMMALFLIAIVPAGLIMRLLRDPLQKNKKPVGESYWIKADAAEATHRSMKNQY